MRRQTNPYLSALLVAFSTLVTAPLFHDRGTSTVVATLIGDTAYRGKDADSETFTFSTTVDQFHRRLDTRDPDNNVRPLNDFGQETYGVDVSFPMHKWEISTNYDTLPHNVDPANNAVPEEYVDMPIQPLGNRQEIYDNYLQGCRDFYKEKGRSEACDQTEQARIQMNLRQPQSMQNYTDMGFKKIKAPERVFKLIQEFWKNNHDNTKKEEWSTGNTYTNHWDTNTDFVSVEDSSLRGGGGVLKQKIWDAAQTTLEEWTGQELTPCSMYGVRIYREGAMLATHVDRLPLVTSAIINVAQDVDEPWPIEVYGHDGKAYNVTLEPGEMAMYESHSVLHGRPFALKGRFYANIFIHFEPLGHSIRHGVEPDGDVSNQYRKAVENGDGGHETSHHDLPPYLIHNSPEEPNWKRSHPSGWDGKGAMVFTTGSTLAHRAAMDGDVDTIKEIAASNRDALHRKDVNGWQPIHEASRGGHTDVVQLLIEHGADFNERVNQGQTPLHLARKEHGEDHPLVALLQSVGALDLGPDF